MPKLDRAALRCDSPLALETALPRPPCKMCGFTTFEFAAVDFRKHCSHDPYAFGFSGVPIYYFRCHRCDCVFTDFFDHWSSEDFAACIYNDDYIKVDPDYTGLRAERTAAEWQQRFRGFEGLSALDYGSGAGIFASQMNGSGFRFDCYDPFSSPRRPDRTFDFVVSFEVIEHSPKPLATFADMFSFCGEQRAIIFGQSLQPDDIMAQRGNWWYLAPRNGHVTTYSLQTLLYFARQNGLELHGGHGLYALASPGLTGPLAELMSRVGPSPKFFDRLNARA